MAKALTLCGIAAAYPQMHKQSRKCSRKAKDTGDAPCAERWYSQWVDALIAAYNFSYAPKHFSWKDRRIRLWQRIASHDEPRAFLRIDSAENAMGKESALAAIQYYIAGNDVSEGALLDLDSVTWPNRRKHAVARQSQTQPSEGAQSFSSDFALERVSTFLAEEFAANGSHDTFRLRMQPLCVA